MKRTIFDPDCACEGLVALLRWLNCTGPQPINIGGQIHSAHCPKRTWL